MDVLLGFPPKYTFRDVQINPNMFEIFNLWKIIKSPDLNVANTNEVHNIIIHKSWIMTIGIVNSHWTIGISHSKCSYTCWLT